MGLVSVKRTLMGPQLIEAMVGLIETEPRVLALYRILLQTMVGLQSNGGYGLPLCYKLDLLVLSPNKLVCGTLPIKIYKQGAID